SRELVAERRAALTAAQAMRSTVEEVRFRDLHIAILDTTQRLVASTAPPEADAVAAASRRPAPDVGSRIVTALRGADLTKPVALTFSSDDGGYRVIARPLT